MSAQGAIRSDFFSAYAISEQRIGSGAAADVFRAVRLQGDVHGVGAQAGSDDGPAPSLAVKVFKPTKDRVTTWRQEVKMLVAVQAHPGLVRFHALFCERDAMPQRDLWCLLMEPCAEGDLWSYVVEAPLPEGRAREVMRTLLAALAHVHARGIVHRDVKAENILLTAGGQSVLSGFGVACLVSDAVKIARRVGTPGYAAPEVLTSRGCTEKADVFSAGVVLVLALCGELPFQGASVMETLRSTVLEPLCLEGRPRLQHVSAACQDFMQALLEKGPRQRPSAASAGQAPWLAA